MNTYRVLILGTIFVSHILAIPIPDDNRYSPSFQDATPTPGYAVGSTVFLYSDDEYVQLQDGPGTSNVIGVLPQGSQVAIQEGPVILEEVDWYRINGDGFEGWVLGAYLFTSNPISETQAAAEAQPAGSSSTTEDNIANLLSKIKEFFTEGKPSLEAFVLLACSSIFVLLLLYRVMKKTVDIVGKPGFISRSFINLISFVFIGFASLLALFFAFLLLLRMPLFVRLGPIEIPWIIIIYIAVSLVTFLAYGIDKFMAKRKSWRIAEAVLHFLELLGGWPGGIAGIILLRHKISQADFLFLTGLTTLLHIVVWVLWFGLR